MSKESGNSMIGKIDAWLDKTGEKLKAKEYNLPTDLIGGVLALVFAIVMLFIIPTQIELKKKEIVNGRQFPSMLMYLMIACAIILIGTHFIKILRHEEVKRTKINLLVEVRALIIFADMLIYFFVCKATDSFAIGSCVFVILMMLFFRCKKWNYYAITLSVTIAIWAAFRYGLNVFF